MTVTVAKILLAPRERQVVEGMADGSTLAEVASALKTREGAASVYLKRLLTEEQVITWLH